MIVLGVVYEKIGRIVSALWCVRASDKRMVQRELVVHVSFR